MVLFFFKDVTDAVGELILPGSESDVSIVRNYYAAKVNNF